jgi:Uma2 family endonuclease
MAKSDLVDPETRPESDTAQGNERDPDPHLDFEGDPTREVLQRSELRALWLQMAGNPSLPARYELTEHGELVVHGPPSSKHDDILEFVASEIRYQLGGLCIPNVPMLTGAGVRVPDLLWISTERHSEVLTQHPLEFCPSLLVTVLSPATRSVEVNHRCNAYLSAGAREVIIISPTGAVSYRRADGSHTTSDLGVTLNLDEALFVG